MLGRKDKRDFRRIVVTSDRHSGHLSGLTHPDFERIPSQSSGHLWDMYLHRRRCWEWTVETVKELQPIDVLLDNGDAIDGKGEASGGTEQITTDRNEQVDMAVASIEVFDAETTLMSYGTPYHAGKGEDWEKQVFDKITNGRKIGGEDTFQLAMGGPKINYRHHIGRSSIPHGRATPLAKERLWNLLWSERGEYPKADILIRSHVHYFAYVGDADWLAISTPALSGYGSKFGTRRCLGAVDFGLLWIDVFPDGHWTWNVRVKRFTENKRKLVLV